MKWKAIDMSNKPPITDDENKMHTNVVLHDDATVIKKLGNTAYLKVGDQLIEPFDEFRIDIKSDSVKNHEHQMEIEKDNMQRHMDKLEPIIHSMQNDGIEIVPIIDFPQNQHDWKIGFRKRVIDKFGIGGGPHWIAGVICIKNEK
jgi:hypothetical protein